MLFNNTNDGILLKKTFFKNFKKTLEKKTVIVQNKNA